MEPPLAEIELLLPCKLLIEIAPLETPARVRTAASPKEMVAPPERPSSMFTSYKEIVPVERAILVCRDQTPELGDLKLLFFDSLDEETNHVTVSYVLLALVVLGDDFR